jgi:hypothetical protein
MGFYCQISVLIKEKGEVNIWAISIFFDPCYGHALKSTLMEHPEAPFLWSQMISLLRINNDTC